MNDAEQESDLTQGPHSAHIAMGLVVVLLIALGVRLVAIERPLLGHFATKNVVYGMIARNLVEGRASFWLPRVDCLCAGQRGLHLLEVPLSAYVAGGLWRLLGGSLDVWGRAVSIGFSMAAVLALFDLVRRRHGQSAANGAAMVLSLSPVAVIYGQHFMLEASIVFFAVATIDALDRWLAGRRVIWLAVAAVCFGLLTLTKIYMVVLLLPIGYMLFIEGRRVRACTHGRNRGGGRNEAVGQALPDGNTCNRADDRADVRHSLTYGNGACKHAPYVAAAVFLAAALPAVAWVAYVMHATASGGPLADHVFYSLRDSTESHRLPHPLLGRPDFYRRLFDDLATVVLTPVAFMLPLVGLLDRAWRRWAAWLLAMGFLVVAMPRKFFEMNYYWLVVLPPLAILAGLGWARLAERLRLSRAAMAVLLVVALAASFRYTIIPLATIPAEDRAVLPAAEAMRRLAREGEPVVTMHGSGIDLLYYCDRPGWALEPDEPKLAERLAECARAGARFVAIVDVEHFESPDRSGRLAGNRPVTQGEGFRIYDIREGGTRVRHEGRGAGPE